MTPSERLKRFLDNRGTGFSADDIAEVLAENDRLRAALEIIEASENLLGPELRAIARAALEAFK